MRESAAPGEAALAYAEAVAMPRLPQRIDWSQAPVDPEAPPGGLSLAWDPPVSADWRHDTLTVLARLLRHGAAVTRRRWDAGTGLGYGTTLGPLLRPAPSGGARFPADVRALVSVDSAMCALTYDPLHHRLHSRRPIPPGWRPSHPLLAITVMPARNRFKYREFGYRLHCLDAGVLIGQLLEVAASMGSPLTVQYFFNDGLVEAALGVDGRQSAAYALLCPEPPSVMPQDTHGVMPQGAPGGGAGGADRDVVSRVHRAARLTGAAPAEPLPRLADRAAPVRCGPPTGLPEQGTRRYMFARRRSSRGYFSDAALSAAQAGAITGRLVASYHSDLPGGVPFAQTMVWVVVNNVTGIKPGLYLAGFGASGLVPVRYADMRAQLQRTVLYPVFNAARVPLCIIPVTAYEPAVRRYGDRWYRIQNMEAGVLIERAYLAAADCNLACQVHCAIDPQAVRALIDPYHRGMEPLAQILVGHGRTAGSVYELPL
jgi:hypothetical protein